MYFTRPTVITPTKWGGGLDYHHDKILCVFGEAS